MASTSSADRPSWKERSAARQRRAGARRLGAIALALLVICIGTVVFVVTRPKPAEELAAAAHAIEPDWPALHVDALVAKWFKPSLTPVRRERLDMIFERRGWIDSRPSIRYVLHEMKQDATKGRSEYEIECFPKDRRLTIYWDRIDDAWKVSAPKIPILRDE